MSTYELYHHGILGMKWGVRRYQNRDGTLTAKGKKRYGKDGETSAPKQTVVKKQPPKRLTMEELQEKKNRLELEKRVLELEDSIRKMTMPEVAQTPQAQKGRGMVKEILGDAARNTGKKLANNIGDYAVDALLKKAGIKAGADEMEMFKKEAEKVKTKAEYLRNKEFIDNYANANTKEAREAKKKMDDMRYQTEYAKAQWQKSTYEDDYKGYQAYKKQKQNVKAEKNTSTESNTKADSTVDTRVHKYTRSTQKYSDVIDMTKEGERYVANFLDSYPNRKFRKTY